jgi:hypothetical protein
MGDHPETQSTISPDAIAAELEGDARADRGADVGTAL